MNTSLYIARTSLPRRTKAVGEKSNMAISRLEIFGNVMLKAVPNSRDHREQRKFKNTATGSYLLLLFSASTSSLLFLLRCWLLLSPLSQCRWSLSLIFSSCFLLK